MVRLSLVTIATALTIALSAIVSTANAALICEPTIDSMAVAQNYIVMNPVDGSIWGADVDNDGHWITRQEDHGRWRSLVHRFSDVIIALHFLDDGTMFVSTDADYQSAAYPCSLFRSVDNGETFVPVLVLSAACAVNFSFAHDPLNHLYVGEYGPRGQGQSNRVWKTTDKGDTWSVTFQTPDVDDIHIHRVAVDPYTQDVWVSFGHSQAGTYRSQDGGAHWSMIYGGLPPAMAFTPDAIYLGEDHYLGIVNRYDRATGVIDTVLKVSSLGPYGGSVYDMTVGRSGQVYVPFMKYPEQTHYPSIWVGRGSEWHLLEVFGEPQTGANTITPPDRNGDMFVMYHRIHEPCDDTTPPAPPDCFTAEVIDESTALHWCGPNLEPDFWSYRLYSGTTADFVPSPTSLVIAKGDTGYTIPSALPMFYKLTAVDRSGNESPPTMVCSAMSTDVPTIATPLTLRVGTNPVTRAPLLAEISLSTPAPAMLELLDVAGRRLYVRRLGGSPAVQAVSMAPGGTLRSGEYFLRLTQGRSQIVKRVAVVR